MQVIRDLFGINNKTKDIVQLQLQGPSTLFAQTKKLPEECVEAVLDAKKIADKTSKVVFDTHTKHGGWKGQNMGQIKADVTCLLHGNYLYTEYNYESVKFKMCSTAQYK